MSLIFLCLAIVALWINLVGAGLATLRYIGDYAVSRVVSVIGICLVGLCIEHSVGLGPRLRILPLTTAVSIWLIWRNWPALRANWRVEALFGSGFFYCLLWRYTFPDIDYSEDKMPNFALIEAYMRGGRLPAPDLWLARFDSSGYYSFQHYGASLIGRLLGVGPGVSYHLASCTLVGFLVLMIGACFMRFCTWRPGIWVGVLCLVLGGNGVTAVAHFLVEKASSVDLVRFLGGAIVHGPLTPLGETVSKGMTTAGVEPRDLPMEPLSYFLSKGDYHPPMAGFVLLALAALLIAAQETGASGRIRTLNSALLASTIPIALISNAWVLPLQFLLVAGWFVYRFVCGEKSCIGPGLVGAAIAVGLEYPFLVEFTQQAIGSNVALRMTEPNDHTPLLGWLLMFWPVIGIMVLGALNPTHRSFSLYLVIVWAVALIASEFFYNHDLYGGPFARFNSTLKWWQWIYAGIILTLGACNLGSKSRMCRVGTMIFLLPNLTFAYDLARQYKETPKEAVGQLSGAAWISKDVVVKDIIAELGSRPDGVTLESGLMMANSESPAVTLFANKQSFLGWPWMEEAYRGGFFEIPERFDQINRFYQGKLPDPLNWLLHNDVRYILWLPKDNDDRNSRFRPLLEKIKARYYWHGVYGNDNDFAIGYWERIDRLPGEGEPIGQE